MVSRAGEFPSASELPSAAELEGAAPVDVTNRSSLAPRPAPAARTPGTAVLVDAFTFERRSLLATASKAASPDPAVAILERSIRSNPAYQSLSTGDKAVADWIMWRASMAPPLKQLYYLNKLDTLFKTPSDKPLSAGSEALSKQVNAWVDEGVALERARGNVFRGEEELLSAGAVLSNRRGKGGTIYRVDARDPRAVVVKVKIHLQGAPDFIAKIKAFEDSIEKRASTRGYTLDVEFVDKAGADVFSVSSTDKEWPTSKNLAGHPEILAHEIHHLLGLADRYDLIESHADNKSLALNHRLYLFALQMKKPPDPRGPDSLMGKHDRHGPLLSEDVCAVIENLQQECIDARKEFDPPGLPPHGPHSIH